MGLVQRKLEEFDLVSKVKLFPHEAGEVVKAGCFQVEFIHMNHSIADAVAFAIKTPVGTVVMTGDFKIDSTASEGIADLGRLGQLGKEGVLALLCDSTNVERPGYSASETQVADAFDRQFKDCDQRIIVTTFASNAHRLQNLINVAHKYGRKVAVTGRSMENVLKVSMELGYLKVPARTLVDISAIKNLPKNKIVIVSTGSQGENMSALYRMAFTGHKQVEIQPGDRIIISASAIPGNEKSVSRIINELYRKGADVVCDKSADLHASGHASQEELKIIHALLKPRFFIPVHGEQRHLQAHARLAKLMGMDPKNILISDVGRVIELTKTTCKLTGTVPSGRILVDGSGVGGRGQRGAPRPQAPGAGRHAGGGGEPLRRGRQRDHRPRYHHPRLCLCEGIGEFDGGNADHRRPYHRPVRQGRYPRLERPEGQHQVRPLGLPLQDHQAQSHDPACDYGDLNKGKTGLSH